MAGFEHVQKGQRIRIPATTWNALMDMAKREQGSLLGGGAGSPGLPAVPVPVKYDGAVGTIPRGGLLAPTGHAWEAMMHVELPDISTGDGPGRLCVVAAAEISGPGIVPAYIGGKAPVYAADYDNVRVGDRLGFGIVTDPLPLPYAAVVDAEGPLKCVGKLESPLIMCEITREIGGRIAIRFGADDVRFFHTLILDGNFAGAPISASPTVLNIVNGGP